MTDISEINKNQVGRPELYTPELAHEICYVISNSSKGLNTLCDRNPHWPKRTTIYDWVLINKEFSDMYARAKILQAHLLADETIEISDDSSRDTILKKNKDGEIIAAPNTEWIQRSRLRVDSRKWYTSKLAPRLYGERLFTEHSGNLGLHEKSLQELDKNDGDK